MNTCSVESRLHVYNSYGTSLPSVVDLNVFFSGMYQGPDPTFQLVSDPETVPI
jgi:hypothetical protein